MVREAPHKAKVEPTLRAEIGRHLRLLHHNRVNELGLWLWPLRPCDGLHDEGQAPRQL
jgi:hypothetical protein